MSLCLYDFLKKDLKKMINSISDNERGNIYPLIMQEVEKYIIILTLEETKNNYLKASRILGISRSTLYNKLKVLDIPVYKIKKSSLL